MNKQQKKEADKYIMITQITKKRKKKKPKAK